MTAALAAAAARSTRFRRSEQEAERQRGDGFERGNCSFHALSSFFSV
jgi:hypothetical protein